MIRFVDTHTGDVYNGDMPYIHWFDGIQSVGLNYAKQFIVISDNSFITVQLPSSKKIFLNEEVKTSHA